MAKKTVKASKPRQIGEPEYVVDFVCPYCKHDNEYVLEGDEDDIITVECSECFEDFKLDLNQKD